MWPKKLFFILIAAFLIRLINLNQSLWWDESINVVYARDLQFLSYISEYPIADFHPPGYFAILWLWGRVAGFSEVAIRLPSVIFGVLTILISFLIAKKLFNEKIGIITSLLLAFAPLHVYYSQEARMYVFASFAVALSTYSLVFLDKRIITSIFYAVSLVVVLLSDYLAYFILPVHALWIFLYQRNLLKKFLIAVFLAFFVFSPWMTIFPKQLINGQQTSQIVSGWGQVVGGISLKEIILLPTKVITGRISFENNFIYGVFTLFLSLPLLLAFLKVLKFKDSKIALILMWLLLPPIIGIIVSFFIPIFSYFRLIFILPAFYLLIVYGIEKYKYPISFYLTLFVFVSCLVPTSIYLFNPIYHREDWKGAIKEINRNSESEVVVLTKYNETIAPFKYYNLMSENYPGLKVVPALDQQNVFDEQILYGTQKVYLFEYLTEITDPYKLVEQKLETELFQKTDLKDFRGIGFVSIYEKKQH